MFGLYYLLRDVVVSLAAFSAGWLWNISPQANFLTAFGFGVLGTVFFIVFGRDVTVPRQKQGHKAQSTSLKLALLAAAGQ